MSQPGLSSRFCEIISEYDAEKRGACSAFAPISVSAEKPDDDFSLSLIRINHVDDFGAIRSKIILI
ncbi:hypothetical protein CAK95_19875 [Pseudorhodoplanes sinuspersici]|uniref:Uncharacterized protein n=1 Tax=Pseudorhodoplanes sinuspersici TaxID=1235591 RepID=A0A1W6ZVE6_9HYPH|nr:hypothetical protein CAK95_19875 [Pseudorhodoplanes sinuspersici]